MPGLLQTRGRLLKLIRRTVKQSSRVIAICFLYLLPCLLLAGCLSTPKASKKTTLFETSLETELETLAGSAGGAGLAYLIGGLLILLILGTGIAFRMKKVKGASSSKQASSTAAEQPDSSQYLSIAALVLGAIAISFAAIFAEKAIYAGYMGTTSVGFWRFALAIPVFLVMMAIVPKRTHELPKPGTINPLWLLLPGLLFAGDIGFWHAALPYTTASNATLLANIQVFIVGFFGWLLLKEKLRPFYVLGLILAFVGIWLLLTLGNSPQDNATSPLLGDSLSIVTAFWYAGYLLMVKWLRRDFRTLEIMVTASMVGAAVLFLAAILRGEVFIPYYNESMPEQYSRAWTYLILLALVPQCIGQGLIAWSFFRLPASFSAVVLLLQPVCAAFLGWWMLSEVLTNWQLAASGFVLVGIVLARLGSRSSS